MLYECGDVVLLPFPFTNQATFKKRPGVVVSSSLYNRSRPDVIVRAITSQLRPDVVYPETWIERWQSAGLLKPSAIKPVFATIEQTLIIRTIGSLAEDDRARLRSLIERVFG